jgi:hypothetical protein
MIIRDFLILCLCVPLLAQAETKTQAFSVPVQVSQYQPEVKSARVRCSVGIYLKQGADEHKVSILGEGYSSPISLQNSRMNKPGKMVSTNVHVDVAYQDISEQDAHKMEQFPGKKYSKMAVCELLLSDGSGEQLASKKSPATWAVPNPGSNTSYEKVLEVY